MTEVSRLPAPAEPTAAALSVPPAWIGLAAVGVGTALLLARPLLAVTLGWTDWTVLGVFGAVLGLGLATPVLGSGTGASLPTSTAVLAAGFMVFCAGRLLAVGHAPDPASLRIVGLSTLAAVAEEAIFRRVAYHVLLPAGPVVAVAVPAMLFGLAHVTVYGWWALPVDMASGLVFGWQRWASGSWTVPAVTHALADLLVVI